VEPYRLQNAITDTLMVIALCAACILFFRQPTIIEHVNAAPLPLVEAPAEEKIEWTKKRIEEEIRLFFPETPELAVKIAKCESGLKPDIQSRQRQTYGQEQSFGLFQIHAPDWHDRALELGYTEYKTAVQDNIKMARYIYEQAGKRWGDWSCYTKGML